MRPGAFIIAALGGCSAIFLGAAVTFHYSQSEADAASRRLGREEASIDLRIRRTTRTLAELAADELATEAGSAALPNPSNQRPTGIASILNTPSLMDMMDPDPRRAELAAMNHRAITGRVYAAYFRPHHFNSEQIEKFESLADQHAKALVDIAYAAIQNGTPLDDAAAQALVKDENDRAAAAQRELLGDSAYEQLQQYARLVPVNKVVQELASSVALTSDPITGFQADQLKQALANASSRYRLGRSASEPTIDWPAALDAARSILDPNQFSWLQDEHAAIQAYELEKQFMDTEYAARQKGP